MRHISLNISVLSIIIATIVSISSCSGGDDQYRLLHTVSADAVSCSTVQLDDIVQKTGISLTGDTVNLPQALASISGFNSAFTDAAAVYKGIIDRRVVIFSLPRDPSNYIVTFLFDDIKSLSPLIGYREKEVRNGFDIYGSVVIRSNQCWLFSGKTRSTRLSESLKRAEEKSILDTPLGETLLADHDINTLVSTQAFSQIPGMPDLRLTATTDITDRAITCSLSAYTPLGVQVSLKNNGYLSPIATEFLSLTSPHATAIAAIGIDKAFNISGLTPWLMISGMSTSYITLISEVIDAIDGTVAISATPRIAADSLALPPFTLADWDLTLSAQIKDKTAKPLLLQARNVLSEKGYKVKKLSDTDFTVTLPDTEIAVTLAQGHLTISNHPHTECADSLTPFFADKYFALSLHLPGFGSLIGNPSLTMGYNFDVNLDESNLNISLKVTDYPGTIINSFFDLIPTPESISDTCDTIANALLLDLDVIDQLNADRHL